MRLLLIALAASQRALHALVLRRSIKHISRAFQASSPKTSKAGPRGRLFLSSAVPIWKMGFVAYSARGNIKQGAIGMTETLTTTVLQVIERTPQWVRHDLESKEPAVRIRAEETLAAMIAAALHEVSGLPVN